MIDSYPTHLRMEGELELLEYLVIISTICRNNNATRPQDHLRMNLTESRGYGHNVPSRIRFNFVRTLPRCEHSSSPPDHLRTEVRESRHYLHILTS